MSKSDYVSPGNDDPIPGFERAPGLAPGTGVREITVRGARQHNLKNIDVSIPRNALVVITGPSGSGKSSLAFDTLYAEGQRRYVESLSTYARQFLDQMQKPDVDHIDGLSPAIAIEQRSAGAGPRSIVATTTELYDYLRLLYAHIGHPHCPSCGRPVHGQSPEKICDQLMRLPPGRRLMVLAPYVRGRKGRHREVLERMRQDGHVRARINGEIRSLDQDIALPAKQVHELEAVVDRLVTGEASRSRLNDSVERALRCGDGEMLTLLEAPDSPGKWLEDLISEHLACAVCRISIGELQPRNFSFNSPYGACPECHGLGTQEAFEASLVVDDDKGLGKGAVPLWRIGPRRLITYHNRLLRCLAAHYDVSLETPFRELPERIQRVVLYGSGAEEITFTFRWAGRQQRVTRPFEGVLPNLTRRYRETESSTLRDRFRKAMVRHICSACKGARLRAASLAVTVGDRSIHAFLQLSVERAADALRRLELSREEGDIARELLHELTSRLGFLNAVGLGYLTLDRQSNTLSGGEAQRIRLGTQVGSGLTGVLYILDEPSIGLHQRDQQRLLSTLTRLRDIGNTVVVVEHDPETIRKADHIVDLGPGAGAHGGQVVCSGPLRAILACAHSLTGRYLSGREFIPVPTTRCSGNGRWLTIRGARQHNLHNLTVRMPLGTLTGVAGVSGSGKSTLVNMILTRAVRRHLGSGRLQPGEHDGIDGLEQIHKIIEIDQSPIGRTPRSNPVTYTNAFDVIRRLFAKVPESRVRGYKPGRFSFNVKGGRCEDCRGDGIKKIEMQFLPDVYVQCETCKGARYNHETLSVYFKGRNIAEVLDMTVDEAADLFDAIPKLKRILTTLAEVGLGYVRLGQPATTLSGGEAQRVKLAAELARPARGHTLYVLDEPTTGLHMDDVRKLLDVLQSLRDRGNTVVVIEHNLDVLKVCDYLVDLGPEGGDAGGRLLVCGAPEAVAACEFSYTGEFLRACLGQH